MMKTPFFRAASSVRFMGSMSSPTRDEADLHQWSSHMSHTMMAVRCGSHDSTRSEATMTPEAPPFWDRRWRFMEEEFSGRRPDEAHPASITKASHSQEVRIRVESMAEISLKSGPMESIERVSAEQHHSSAPTENRCARRGSSRRWTESR